MTFRLKDRVQANGSRHTGTVREMHNGKALVRWDDESSIAPGRWIPTSQLRHASSDEPDRFENPPLVYAPEIQDLEFSTRIDNVTQSLMMERDKTYRGNKTPGPTIENAEDIYEFWRHLGEKPEEHFVVAYLNVRQELLGWRICHIGKHDAVDIDPVEIVNFVVAVPLTDSVIILHNHPSGRPIASEADKKLTKAVEDVLDLHGRWLFDHVVIGRPRGKEKPYYSFRDHGLLRERDGD